MLAHPNNYEIYLKKPPEKLGYSIPSFKQPLRIQKSKNYNLKISLFSTISSDNDSNEKLRITNFINMTNDIGVN